MIRDLWDDLVGSGTDLLDRCLALLMFLVIGLGAVLVFFLGYLLIDWIGITSTYSAVTAVEMKQIHSSYTTLMPVGKLMIPQYHPESYSIYFSITNELVSSYVTRSFFTTVDIGDQIQVEYGFGRLSGEFYAINITITDY
ncbi:hypothetical protein K2P47_00175 [Patescibacteria group bacterium]|nr:hypothetical protein [Patescibacteria group bacterium]